GPWRLLAHSRLRRLRYVGVGALVLLQTGIALTGNYGFFNMLAVVLCVPVLDDGLLRRVLPVDLVAEAPEPRGWRTAIQVLAPVLFFLSALSLWAEIAYTIPGGRGIGRVPGWVTAALGPMSNLPLLQALSRHLLAGTPEVVGLLGRNPFPGEPPRFVRFAQYDYRFSTPAERSRTGAWWRRELVGYLPELR